MAKSHRVSYLVSLSKTNLPFSLIHFNVWGPSPINTSSCHRWFVFLSTIALEWHGSASWKINMKFSLFFKRFISWFRLNSHPIFKSFIPIMVGNSSITYFRLIPSNMAFSIRNLAFRHRNKMTSPRKKIDIFWHAILLDAQVSSRHWGVFVATAMYLRNRMPSKVLQFKTPL